MSRKTIGMKLRGYRFEVSPLSAWIICPPKKIFQTTHEFAWYRILRWQNPFRKSFTVQNEAVIKWVEEFQRLGVVFQKSGVSLRTFAQAAEKSRQAAQTWIEA